MIRVLIVDDHPALRTGLGHLLGAEDEVEVVGFAAGGQEGVAMALEHAPDVILMDLEMPDLDGAAATREIVRARPGSRIVVLTSFGDRPRILEVIEAGAAGYLLRNVGSGGRVDLSRAHSRTPGGANELRLGREAGASAAPVYRVGSYWHLATVSPHSSVECWITRVWSE